MNKMIKKKNFRAEINQNIVEISILEKALELACEKLPMEYDYCSGHPERYNIQYELDSDEPYYIEEGGCEFDSPANCLECVIKYFKSKARDIILADSIEVKSESKN